MTNLGHTSPIAGPRGRRASVATDKPVDLPPTSLRGTMERQRSPRGSIVPDIALDMGNGVEVVPRLIILTVYVTYIIPPFLILRKRALNIALDYNNIS